MNNYKDTGRVYTLRDLFDLGLKLEAGDEVEHNGCVNFSEGREINYLDSYNTQVTGLDDRVKIVSSKQLDEHLEKQAMNEIKHTAQEDEAFEAITPKCFLKYGDKCVIRGMTCDATFIAIHPRNNKKAILLIGDGSVSIANLDMIVGVLND